MHRLRQIAYFSKETANSDWMSVLQGFVNKRQQQQIDPFVIHKTPLVLRGVTINVSRAAHINAQSMQQLLSIANYSLIRTNFKAHGHMQVFG